MKKYIIMGQISGIGGWQLYIDARTTYLTDNGIKVYILSISDEKKYKILLKSFQKCNKYCIPEIHLPPCTYTRNQKDRIISKMLKFIDYNEKDEIFIESTDIPLSMWGEILAEKTQGVNFSYLLHSHIENISTEVQRFFEFKYRQNLLAGMSELTLPDLFKNYMDIPEENTRRILAVPKDPLCDENDLSDVTFEVEKFKERGGKIIAYFGNLTKPHFVKVCKAIPKYVKCHQEEKFLFLSVGSSAMGKAEKLQKKIEKLTPNCIVKNIPACYPIPKKIFQIMDVCIASWGCADNAARAKALTIRLMDDVSITPQGIMGVTLKGIEYFSAPPSDKNIYEILDEILYENKYSKDDIEFLRDVRDYTKYEIEQDKIMQPFKNKERQKQYYNIESIKYINRRAQIERIMNQCLGVKITQKIIEIVKSVLVRNS